MEELINIRQRKRDFTIFGISIWRIFSYFIIYSFLGYIIETIFQIVSKGLLESKQSFLYGPFCAVYGVGAIIMIICLKNIKKDKWYLFLCGFLIGAGSEYIMSLILEKIFGIVWWDYSNMPLNINGRVCVLYSIYWGILAMVLMLYINPKVDQFIDWAKNKFLPNKQKIIVALIMIFLILDMLITCFALYAFYLRIVHNYNLQVSNRDEIEEQYNDMYSNENLSNIIYNFFDDEKIMKTFPTIKIVDAEENIIYIREILPDIQTYYYKFE